MQRDGLLLSFATSSDEDWDSSARVTHDLWKAGGPDAGRLSKAIMCLSHRLKADEVEPDQDSLTWHVDFCRPANDPQLMSYRSYLDSFLLPFEEGNAPEVQRHNSKIKARRQALKRNFTAPGQPGEMFRSETVYSMY